MTFPRQPLGEFQESYRSGLAYPGSGFAAAVAATGTITFLANTSMADGDTLTIGDGIKTPVVFEYDKSANGVTGGHTSIAAGTTAASIAALFRTAILAAFPALGVVDNADGSLTLTHHFPGTGGNVAMTGTVTNIVVTGMSGGLAEVATGLTATTTFVTETLDRATRFDSVEILSPTGFVQDAANYWTIALKAGATTVASWSTLTGAEGTITANVAALMTLDATDTHRVGAAGAALSVVFTKTGSPAAFPAGRVVAHGRTVA